LPPVLASVLARRRTLGGVIAAALVLVLCGCQVKLRVDVRVRHDGSGTVTVAVGLDHDAVTKAGNLDDQLKVADLEKAGWKVTGPTLEKDGDTWVRASKPFADAAGAKEVMNEINGPDGAFRGWEITRSSNLWGTTWSAKGTIDLSKGMDTFSDPKLDAALGDGGYDQVVKAIEAREGRPIADMVDVAVSVQVPGASHVYSPSLTQKDATVVHVSSSQAGGAVTIVVVVIVAAVGAALVLVLVLLRRRFKKAPVEEPTADA
jgi:hypothetical protein